MAYGIGYVKTYVMFVKACDIINIAADPISGVENSFPFEFLAIRQLLRQKISLNLACHSELFGSFGTDKYRVV